MEQNNLQTIREIFYRMMHDKDLTIEQVRDIAETGYAAAWNLNDDLKNLYSSIGKLWTL